MEGKIVSQRAFYHKFYRSISPVSIVVIIMVTACQQPSVPKPRGYFRIDFPEKKYEVFRSDCEFSFEVPVYGKIEASKVRTAEECWYDLQFPEYKATVYMTYKPIHDNLDVHVEDVRKIVYKHIIKADDIVEKTIAFPEKEVYGIIYRISGNTASSMNFWLTDSTESFVSGALYFDVSPNQDSLGPAIDFFQEDIVHLIHSFQWE